ncbi:MAG: Cmx/CmrA family chloramphenicol efflux MFS transporter [Nocardioidaceae bacterium]
MTTFLTRRSKTRVVPLAVYVLCFNIVTLGTTEFVIAGLLPDLARDFDVSIPRAGLLVSAFAVGMAVGAPVLAVLTLRLPRRSTLLAALGAFAASHALAAVAWSYESLMMARIVAAVSTGAFWAVAAVVTIGLVDASVRARAIAVLIGGLTVANVLGVPLGTYVGQQLGWRTTFWALGALALVGAVAVWRVLPTDGGVASSTGVRSELATFRAPRLWLALATTALFQTAVMGWFAYLAPLLTDVADVPRSWVPVVLTMFGVGCLIGVQIGGRFADARPWRTLYASLTTLALGLALVAWTAHHAVALSLMVFLVGVAAFTAGAPLNHRVLGLAGPAPTLASATNVAAFNVGNTLGPWLGGVTIAAGLGYVAPAVLGAAVAVGALALALLSRELDGDGIASRRTPAEVDGREPVACLT